MKVFNNLPLLVCVVLIAERQTLAERSGSNLRQISLGDGALDNVQPVNVDNEISSSRRLSPWSWILNLVGHCPGPLKCKEKSSGSGGSSSSSSNGGGSSSSSSNGGGSSSSNGGGSSGGDASSNEGGSSGGDASAGEDNDVSNDFDSYFVTTATGGSVTGANAVSNSSNRSSSFLMGIGLATAMAGAFAVYRILNKRSTVPSAHLLDGAVKKRNIRFSRAMEKTNGTMEMGQVNSAGLEGDYVRA